MYVRQKKINSAECKQFSMEFFLETVETNCTISQCPTTNGSAFEYNNNKMDASKSPPQACIRNFPSFERDNENSQNVKKKNIQIL